MKQMTAESVSDVNGLLSVNEGAQIVASKGESGHLTGVYGNKHGTMIRTAPLEDGMGLGSYGIESGGDLVEHGITPQALSKVTRTEKGAADLSGTLIHGVHVKREENYVSDNEGLITASNRTEPPAALGETPTVQVVPAVPASSDPKKKRAHEEEGQANDVDNELTPKRCKSVNADNISQGSRKEVSPGNSDGLRTDEQNLPSPGAAVLSYRTTVVIDSDGEREIEEAVAETTRVDSAPSKSHSTGRRADSLGDIRLRSCQTDPDGDRKKRKWKHSPMKEKRSFPCTACGTLLRNKDVLRHPKLAAGICKRCEKHYLSGPFKKVIDLLSHSLL